MQIINLRLFVDNDDDYGRIVSVRNVQVNAFEPAQVRCRPHSALRVGGLTPLDNRKSPADAVKCDALQALRTKLKSTCEGRQSCVVNFGEIKAIQSSCHHIRYISIDVYCQPGIHHLFCLINSSVRCLSKYHYMCKYLI